MEGELDVVFSFEVLIDDGEVVKEDGHQIGAVEVIVAVAGDMCFDKRHTVEIAEEVRAPDVGGIDAVLAQFAEEAAIAAIDGKGDTAEIGNKVVGGTSVDMIDGHAGRDLLVTPSHIDGMGRKDMFTATENLLELQIVVIAMAIFVPIILACGIFQYFSTVGIDAHAYYATLAVVGVEGDVILRVRADIAHLDVVKEEGRADQIRLADDFKFSFIHKHRQSEGCLFRKAVQK